MSLNVSGQDRKLLVGLGILFVFTLIAGLIFSPSRDAQADLATTYSAAAAGTKAAYLLLRESGFQSERWEQSPTALTLGPSTLIIADPTAPPRSEEQAALKRYVANGGRLILAGRGGFLFMPGSAPTEDPFGLRAWEQFSAQAPSATTRQAAHIHMQANSFWTTHAEGMRLYGNDTGRFVVLQQAVGKGQIFWLASASVLSNAGLEKPDNLEFLLAVAGDRQERVLWDEYFHGHRTGATSGIEHPQFRWFFAQLFLLAAAILGTYARRSGPQRAPVEDSRLSPLEFVQALGDLYSTARAANVAVDIYYGRFRYLATKRLALPVNASPADVVAAFERQRGVGEPDLLALLQTCESARFFPDLKRGEALKLVRELYDYARKLQLFPKAGPGEH
jgi:Domain of unknown function (DUF4350)